jgi:GNAT superfamily N-acetyltransferase
MTEVAIRPAAAADLPMLGIIGPAAHAAAYHYLWPEPSGLSRRLETFGEAAMRDFLARPGAHVWLAEWDGAAVGFLTMLIGSPDPIERRGNGAEIPRIFLLPSARGLGIGRKLFEAALAKAREAKLAYVWLDAMDSADWALATYDRWGLERIGTSTFSGPIPSEYAGLVVFRMELRA